MEIPIRTNLIILAVVVLGLVSAPAQTIKTFPLDDHTVYHLKVATDKVTTIVFPQGITDIEGSGVTADPKVKANLLLSYHAGDRFFSVRALKDEIQADLNVICDRSVYVLELATDKEPFQSVRFYSANQPMATMPGSPPPGQNPGPNRLLGLLDQAKAYPLLAEQHPEMVSQIEQAEPHTLTLYRGFDVTPNQMPAGVTNAPPAIPPELPLTLYHGEDKDAPQVSDTYAPYGRLSPPNRLAWRHSRPTRQDQPPGL